jgi:plastocyanin
VKRRGLTLATLAAIALGIGVSQAFATGAVIVATDESGFATPNPTIAQGLQATFSNGDDETHNVTADDDGPDHQPLFRSGNTAGGTNRLVLGTPFLSAGNYGFHCTIHPDTMVGTLEVLSAGVPQERPEIELKVKSKKLDKVISSGTLKVAVSARKPTDADGVSLSAKKGRKKISKVVNLDVAAGNSKTAKLKLKKSALEKLADLEKAKIKVTAEVDFGSPAKASKKLK